MLPLPPTPANECQRQGLDKDLLKGSSSCSTTLPSGPFLKGAFSWSSAWHCTHSVFFLGSSSYPPKCRSSFSCQITNFALWPRIRSFLSLFCGLESPCQGWYLEDKAPDGMPTAVASQEMPLDLRLHTEASTSAGRAPECENCFLFLSFEDFYRSLRTNEMREMGDSLKSRFLQWAELLLGICECLVHATSLTVLASLCWFCFRDGSVQFSPVSQSCLTLCDPMDGTLPGFPVHHQLLPGACSNSHPLNRWCHPTISSSVSPSPPAFNLSQHQSFPLSQFFTSGGQNIEASVSVLPMNIQHWFPLGLIALISLQSKGWLLSP